MKQLTLFQLLTGGLETVVRNGNPWWRGEPIAELPSFRRWVRSVISLDVAHFPERNAEPEVDFVLTVGEQRIPVEVNYRHRIDHRDTLGLRSVIEKAHYNAPFGVLVTMLDEPGTDDPRIVSVPLASLLLLR